jgi:hypothetical protein
VLRRLRKVGNREAVHRACNGLSAHYVGRGPDGIEAPERPEPDVMTMTGSMIVRRKGRTPLMAVPVQCRRQFARRLRESRCRPDNSVHQCVELDAQEIPQARMSRWAQIEIDMLTGKHLSNRLLWRRRDLSGHRVPFDRGADALLTKPIDFSTLHMKSDAGPRAQDGFRLWDPIQLSNRLSSINALPVGRSYKVACGRERGLGVSAPSCSPSSFRLRSAPRMAPERKRYGGNPGQ